MKEAAYKIRINDKVLLSFESIPKEWNKPGDHIVVIHTDSGEVCLFDSTMREIVSAYTYGMLQRKAGQLPFEVPDDHVLDEEREENEKKNEGLSDASSND